MKSPKAWIKTANGWERLWLVITAASVLYAVTGGTATLIEPGNKYRYENRSAILREMSRPQCAAYMNRPFNELPKPEYYNSSDYVAKPTCLYIYQEREAYDPTTVPYTEEVYRSRFSASYYSLLFEMMGGSLLVALGFSILLYLFGWVAAWIRWGFASPGNQ